MPGVMRTVRKRPQAVRVVVVRHRSRTHSDTRRVVSGNFPPCPPGGRSNWRSRASSPRTTGAGRGRALARPGPWPARAPGRSLDPRPAWHPMVSTVSCRGRHQDRPPGGPRRSGPSFEQWPGARSRPCRGGRVHTVTLVCGQGGFRVRGSGAVGQHVALCGWCESRGHVWPGYSFLARPAAARPVALWPDRASAGRSWASVTSRDPRVA
jgi:hypothetical protein